MTFTVEDGTGVVNSNSYCDLAFADSYFEDRQISAWANAADDSKMSSLIKATDYIENRFSAKFKGTKTSDTQSLSFPRVEYTGIPIALKKATAEYALRALTSPLAPDPEMDASGYGIERKYEKIGPIETETRYKLSGQASNMSLLRPYPSADMLIRSLLNSSLGVIRG